MSQFGRSDTDRDSEDDDEYVMKGADSKLESSLLSSDLEFYIPPNSSTPRTQSFADDSRQSQDSASRNARRPGHKTVDVTDRNKVVCGSTKA